MIVDPISNFSSAGTLVDAEAMLLRLVDFLKARQITALFTNLTAGGDAWERTDVGISSLIDTWLLLRDIELDGERNRGLYVLKSRGMEHSNQIREFLLTSRASSCRTSTSARRACSPARRAPPRKRASRPQALARRQEIERKQRDLDRKRAALEAQIAALRAEFEAVEDESEARGRAGPGTRAAPCQ